tara:strand:- start:7050 stop:8057 length:1008 start_codon:yes stop_codon:yes gene_type:complete
MAIPFLRNESEEEVTQSIAFIGTVTITLALAVFNVVGAISRSEPTTALGFLAAGAFGVLLAGLELMAAVALVRALVAPTRLRLVLGIVVFFGLAWVCVQNGKYAAKEIFPELKTNATLLEAKSEINGKKAQTQAVRDAAASSALPDMLAAVQADIIEAERQQRLLEAQSPEKIAEMQQMLISNGYYFFQVDGRMGPETERAMRSMGEDLRNELATLNAQEARLRAGIIGGGEQTDTADEDSAAVQAAVQADQAKQNRQAGVWIEVMLWVAEGGRSLGLWLFVVTGTRKSALEGTESEATKKAKLNGKLGNDAKKTKAEGRERSKILIPPKVKAMG